jgi:hypothetical protein
MIAAATRAGLLGHLRSVAIDERPHAHAAQISVVRSKSCRWCCMKDQSSLVRVINRTIAMFHDLLDRGVIAARNVDG